MSDMFPVHEVLAVIERNSRIILEAAGHEIIIVSDTAYARVWIEAFDHRVCVALCESGDRHERKQQRHDDSFHSVFCKLLVISYFI